MGILSITLHDLRFRVRQFLMTVVGAALVFAMGLLLSGMAAGFRAEIDHVVGTAGADSWLIAHGGSARIGAAPVLPASTVARVAAAPGVTAAAPLAVGEQIARAGTRQISVVVVGAEPGALGSTAAAAGRSVRRDGEAVVDSRTGLALGSSFTVAGVPLHVVGTVSGRTLFAGQPVVYVTLRDAQRALFGGRPLVQTVLTRGVPLHVPAGLVAFSPRQVERASLNAMSSAVSSLGNTRIFMWAVAAFIVAALVYVTALERTRDFAVLKALGCSTRLLFAGLALQAVLVALLAAVIAAVISSFMTGLFDQPIAIPGSAFVVLPLSALAVGILASLVALRRAVAADPAAAFAGR